MVCAALPFVAAHSMIWVPPGCTYGKAMFGLDEVRGGSVYGTGTFAGPTGARQPSPIELGQAEHQVVCFYILRSCVVAHLTAGHEVVESLHQPCVRLPKSVVACLPTVHQIVWCLQQPVHALVD